jgi:hypothetical protein
VGNGRMALMETVQLIQKWEVPDAALPLHLRSTFNPEKDQTDNEEVADSGMHSVSLCWLVWFGLVWFGLVWFGIGIGIGWFGLVWFGLGIGLGIGWFGFV